ncbi:angiotensin-converting enzyme [Bicyclus anynana]|uniref:Angiotensin-converting enzyme n=1 Tax=Bicyclus anynana TaxID=110368 RepID=A0ABM3LV16_BICAN|nr:angiotensin-converting enzyme [Bicyclus anynana]
MAIFLLWLLFFNTHSCDNIYKFFDEINENSRIFNSIGADIAWDASLEPNKEGLAERAAKYQHKKISWQHDACRTLSAMHQRLMLNTTQERQAYLLCRGPKYYFKEAREMSNLYEELQSIYSNVEVCIPDSKYSTNLTEKEDAILNYISKVKLYLNMEHTEYDSIISAKMSAGRVEDSLLCLKGEEDFEKMMEFSRKPEVLEWLWSVWREKIQKMREPYKRLVDLENKAARRNGYKDIGDAWRDELELPDLRSVSRQLYNAVKPLYALLHGVVRFCLRRVYGDVVDERGPIPAHLLGNLWSQQWDSLADLILPSVINLDDRIKNLGWTVDDMIKHAEDYYISMGLPAMTKTFWRESVITRDSHKKARCHGTAADMFKNGDFRLLYCSGMTFEDYYVIHHEMGHIQYYMAYEKQPAIFRQANSALHESIGDAIMYGVMAPQHLHRLRLINDSELFIANKSHNDKLGVTENTKSYEDVFTHNTLSTTTFNENYKKVTPKYNTNLGFYEDHIKANDAKLTKGVDNDEILDLLSIDDILIFKQALNKLPQIPFSLLMDEYRWKYFEGSLEKDSLNQEFWKMALELQGIVPFSHREEEYFDIGAKFHVSDNTPYIRYFLSSFLQHQLFENLCKAAVFGYRNAKQPLPDTISLNRCDIYGSKCAGKILKDIMSRGSSQHWQQILKETTGRMEISAASLKRYYQPLYKLLTRLVVKYDIPIGW